MTEPDPPVVFRLGSARHAERTWQPFLERVSLACLEMVLADVADPGGDPVQTEDHRIGAGTAQET